MLRNDYPYDDALNDLNAFIDKHISHQQTKQEFREVFESARKRKTVPMRGIHKKLIDYRREHNDYTTFSSEERDMLEDLMHFWG